MVEKFFEKTVEDQKQSLSIFARDVLKKYGIENAKVECINYEFNATFAVTTEAARRYALRLNINSTRVESNILAEVQWVRHLALVQGLNLPSPIATIDDTYVVSGLHTDSGRQIFGVMYSWIEGEELGDGPTIEQLHTVGASIALMHQNSSEFVVKDGAALPIFSDFFWGTEDYLFSNKSKLIPEHRENLRRAHDLIMKFTQDLFTVSPVHIIHGDIHGWNLMWHEGKLTVFDFDDCGVGIEAQDLAVALYYLDTPQQDTALLDGYKSIRPLPEYSENAMKSLLLQRRLLLLNYLYETNNPEHKEMLPAYLEKTLERVSTFLTDVTQ